MRFQPEGPEAPIAGYLRFRHEAIVQLKQQGEFSSPEMYKFACEFWDAYYASLDPQDAERLRWEHNVQRLATYGRRLKLVLRDDEWKQADPELVSNYTDDCSDPGRLAAFDLGMLRGEEGRRTGDHVLGCDYCVDGVRTGRRMQDEYGERLNCPDGDLYEALVRHEWDHALSYREHKTVLAHLELCPPCDEAFLDNRRQAADAAAGVLGQSRILGLMRQVISKHKSKY